MTKFTQMYLAASDREGEAYAVSLIVRAALELRDPLQAFRIGKQLHEAGREFDEQIMEIAQAHKMRVQVVPSTPILVIAAVHI